ncbi:MAG: metalloprotease PmbA [Pseudomonadota bacterium]
MSSPQPSATPPTGFAYAPAQFQQYVEDALTLARAIGASDAAVEVSEGVGLSVSVRKGETENVERNRDKSMGITVYIGQRRGNASTSDFSRAALEQTVRAAHDIARFTAEDAAAGLPDAQDMASADAAQRDLDLFHPWAIDAGHALQIALRCEAAAFGVDRRITNSEGAGVSAQQSHFFAGNSRGFRGGYASSRHSLSVAPIASTSGRRGDDMQRDAWYTSMRAADEMASPEAVGRYAAERALSRLKSRKIRTCEVPVLFESSLAAGLLGAYVQATSGGALYRKSSFLLDSLGRQVLAPHIDIVEDPHLPRGKGSAPFDDEGVLTHARDVVRGGEVQGYFLSTYSARKLGMRTTGHAGGSQNLTLTSRLTDAGDDLPAMLNKLGRGLFVIELMGQGVNYVTGDYSRGAAGFWVENGRMQYPVHEITIAGNLRDMFKGIVAVGADAYTMGSKTIGSVLIDRLKIAGL